MADPNAILKADFKQGEKVVWITVNVHSGEDGWCRLTHQEIADAMGSARAYVSRTIKKMRDRGWIKSDGPSKLMCLTVTNECDSQSQCDQQSQPDVTHSHDDVTHSHNECDSQSQPASPLSPSSPSPPPSTSTPPLSPSSLQTTTINNNHRRKQGEAKSGHDDDSLSEGSSRWAFVPEHHQHLLPEIIRAAKAIDEGRMDFLKLARRHLAHKGRHPPSATVAEHVREYDSDKVIAAYVITGFSADRNFPKYADTILTRDFTPPAYASSESTDEEDEYADYFDG